MNRSCSQILTWLSWNKKLRYCHDPGIVGVGIAVGANLGLVVMTLVSSVLALLLALILVLALVWQTLTLQIFLLLEDIYSKHRTSAIYTIKGDNCQCIFARVVPFFCTWIFFFPVQYLQQSVEPAYGALVLSFES